MIPRVCRVSDRRSKRDSRDKILPVIYSVVRSYQHDRLHHLADWCVLRDYERYTGLAPPDTTHEASARGIVRLS
jgi:hypothetical protein